MVLYLKNPCERELTPSDVKAWDDWQSGWWW